MHRCRYATSGVEKMETRNPDGFLFGESYTFLWSPANFERVGNIYICSPGTCVNKVKCSSDYQTGNPPSNCADADKLPAGSSIADLGLVLNTDYRLKWSANTVTEFTAGNLN